MQIYLVGGAVRDKLLNLPIKEKDYVVVGSSPQEMLALGFIQVGKDFPVFIHPKTGEEYALARQERKIGLGYQGFSFDTSPDVSLEKDLERRDLTINAMAESEQGTIIDPFHGQKDIQHRILRHVSEAFAEDPVRILRVGRFLARYASLGFKVAPETFALMQKMVNLGEVNALVSERVWKEWMRALTEKNPEKFFEVLAKANALPRLMPHILLYGPGILALQSACSITKDPIIRFACLFYNFPEDIPALSAQMRKESLLNIFNRYKIPTAYKELATLVALHYQNILTSTHRDHSADSLLDLFYKLDIFRRFDRAKQFLLAIEAIALSQKSHFNRPYFQIAMEHVRLADVKQLIQKGYQGLQLANALKKERLSLIQHYMMKNKI